MKYPIKIVTREQPNHIFFNNHLHRRLVEKMGYGYVDWWGGQIKEVVNMDSQMKRHRDQMT